MYAFEVGPWLDNLWERSYQGHLFWGSLCVCVRGCVCVSTKHSINKHIYICIRIRIHIHIHIHIDIDIHKNVYKDLCELHFHKQFSWYIYIYIYMHVNIHTHIHTYRGLGKQDCPVGVRAYEECFVQKSVFVKTKMFPTLMLGPPTVFSPDYTQVDIWT